MEDSKIIALFWQRNESALKEFEKSVGKPCLRAAPEIPLTLRNAFPTPVLPSGTQSRPQNRILSAATRSGSARISR